MARTLIWNTSGTAQTLPAAYGGGAVQQGYGWVVADESSEVVTALGGFAAMHGKWAVAAISTDEALGSIDMGAAGVALIEDVVAHIGSGGSGGPVYWANILNKPAFATVATSGAYADLSGAPSLSDVATSGLYSDLSGSPAIPVAGNDAPSDVGATPAAGVQSTFARADHQHAHGNLNGGSLHSTATTASAGFMSAADKSKLDGLADVASSGSYNDLADKPSQFSGSYNDLTNKPTLFSGDYADLTNAPAAFSGSYDDLTDKPTLFSGAYADLTGKPSLAAVATSGAYADLSGKPSLAAVATSGSFTDLSNKPTKTYDIASFAEGALSQNVKTFKFYAPRNLSLTALNQGGGATVKVQVDDADITYPKSVTAGQLITTVVTVAGTDNYFTIAAVEA